MNKVILIGRLTRDPEDRQALVKYTLAVDRFNKEKEADFINCVCFGKTADFAKNYLTKGTKIAITGHIQTGSYEKDGHRVYTTDVVIDSQEFCESKKQETQSGQAEGGFVSPEEFLKAEKDLPPWLK